MARLQKFYKDKVVPALKKECGYTSVMEVPKILKITLNIGEGAAVNDPKLLEKAVEQLKSISGQQPVVTKAKKSIASFKLREGNKMGCKVTLRNERMYEFLDRLISIAIPRIRDFRGLPSKSFDGYGNYNFGVKELIIFPEINFDQVDKSRGLHVCITTNAKTDDEARRLLVSFGFPFRKMQEKN